MGGRVVSVTMITRNCVLVCLLSSPASSLAPVKSRMVTFWYRLTKVQLENGRQNVQREREREREREMR